jgi:CHAT domain-containing protein
VLAELPSAGCFHFAGHTQLLPGAPLRTALLCTPDVDRDGRLEVRELFGLNLRGCDLAVLSACETLLGRWHQGDEIIGLTRAFLRAGVPTVVASLWNVSDESTFRLMVRFHELRLQAGTSKLQALAQAQREYLTDRLESVHLTAAEKELVERRWQEQSVALDRGLRTRPSGEAAVKSAKRPHPYFWAAFELQGDWR